MVRPEGFDYPVGVGGRFNCIEAWGERERVKPFGSCRPWAQERSRSPRARQPREHLAEAGKARFQVLDDLLGQLVRFGQVVQVGEALVLEPEQIEAGLVAGDQLVVMSRERAGARCRVVAGLQFLRRDRRGA